MERVEIWHPLEGYHGKYEVTKCGRVRSLDRITVTHNEYTGRIRVINFKGKELAVKPTDGYKQVCLYGKYEMFMISVHRLIAKQFIPNPTNRPCVNHIDGNKSNNNVTNLEWVTHSENQIHRCRVLYPNSLLYIW